MMQHTNTASRPSELKITDLRVATVARAPMRCPVIRIDTNQGIYGLGEVRERRFEELRPDAQESHPGRKSLQHR